MKRAPLKLLALLGLPILCIMLLPNLLRDPAGEVKRQMIGRWRSTDSQGNRIRNSCF